jgi:hypothetical protein
MSCKNAKQHSLADSLKDYLSSDKKQLLSLLTKKDARKNRLVSSFTTL